MSGPYAANRASNRLRPSLSVIGLFMSGSAGIV
jgi:hypothetical protein